MTVSLKGGAVHVAMDLGSGSYNDHVDLRGYKLDDGQWHSIEVSRDSRQVNDSGDVVCFFLLIAMHYFRCDEPHVNPLSTKSG